MDEEETQGGVGIWLCKGAIAIVPAFLLIRIFQHRAETAFAVGLFAGILAQHFIPPRGRITHLFLLLTLAAIAIVWLARIH